MYGKECIIESICGNEDIIEFIYGNEGVLRCTYMEMSTSLRPYMGM